MESPKTLYLFNPEHDYALACGLPNYTAPARIEYFKKINSLLPALYAGDGDFILIHPELSSEELSSLPYINIADEKNLTLIKPENLEEISRRIGKVMPWGWDATVRALLINGGIDEEILPSSNDLGNIRKLSHRRNVIPFRKKMAELLQVDAINPPCEIFSIEKAREFLKTYPLTFFKSPWSSSGRGIVVTDHITEKGLSEWLHGVIKKQGSVIAEPSWQKKYDFASEWEIKEGDARFLGLSVFNTSSRGKYHGNVEGSQEELKALIKKNVPEFKRDIIDAQKTALDLLISPFYSGYLGVDMLADNEGNINPCVEINLRLTMGHIPILLAEKQ